MIVTSLQDANALCHRVLVACKVLRLPTMIRPSFGRVHATFKRLASSTKPMSPSTFDRTVVNTTMSASRPWKPSIVLTTTFMKDESSCLSSCTCREYGVSAAMDIDCMRAERFASSLSRAVRRSETIYLTRSTCPALLFEARPKSSSEVHGTKTTG